MMMMMIDDDDDDYDRGGIDAARPRRRDPETDKRNGIIYCHMGLSRPTGQLILTCMFCQNSSSVAICFQETHITSSFVSKHLRRQIAKPTAPLPSRNANAGHNVQ